MRRPKPLPSEPPGPGDDAASRRESAKARPSPPDLAPSWSARSASVEDAQASGAEHTPPPHSEVSAPADLSTQITEPLDREELAAAVAGHSDASSPGLLARVGALFTSRGRSTSDQSWDAPNDDALDPQVEGDGSDGSGGDGIAAQADADQGAREPTPVGARDVWRAARARRKALKSEVRRFTVRARRRRAVWLGSIAAVVLVAVGSTASAYSPLFAVEQVTVIGAEQLDADAVAEALSGQRGTPLPLVDDSAVKAALVGFPLVESYSVEARPPHELVVRIVERTPIGVIESPAGFTLVDAAGVALSTTQTPAAGRPVLTVTGGTSSDAFEAVGQVLRSLPIEIMLQVTAASATSPNDVTLTLGGTDTTIVWGNATASAKKALTLSQAMLSRPPETVSMYDVSSPLAVVIQ